MKLRKLKSAEPQSSFIESRHRTPRYDFTLRSVRLKLWEEGCEFSMMEGVSRSNVTTAKGCKRDLPTCLCPCTRMCLCTITSMYSREAGMT